MKKKRLKFMYSVDFIFRKGRRKNETLILVDIWEPPPPVFVDTEAIYFFAYQ